MQALNKKKQFAVLGLGHFGRSVALTLSNMGYQVLGVDTDEDVVQALASELTHVVSADITDENVLQRLGINNYEVTVVAVGDMESSLMATLLLKEKGAAFVVVKALSLAHGKMLDKIGADKIIYPERDMGMRVAHNLISSSIVDYIEMSDDLSLVSISVPEFLWGKNLIESELRKRFNVNIVAIKHSGATLVNPLPTQVLEKGDEMIIIGEHKNIEKMETNV